MSAAEHPSRRPSEVPVATHGSCDQLAMATALLTHRHDDNLTVVFVRSVVEGHRWTMPRARRYDPVVLATVLGAARRFHR